MGVGNFYDNAVMSLQRSPVGRGYGAGIDLVEGAQKGTQGAMKMLYGEDSIVGKNVDKAFEDVLNVLKTPSRVHKLVEACRNDEIGRTAAQKRVAIAEASLDLIGSLNSAVLFAGFIPGGGALIGVSLAVSTGLAVAGPLLGIVKAVVGGRTLSQAMQAPQGPQGYGVSQVQQLIANLGELAAEMIRVRNTLQGIAQGNIQSSSEKVSNLISGSSGQAEVRVQQHIVAVKNSLDGCVSEIQDAVLVVNNYKGLL